MTGRGPAGRAVALGAVVALLAVLAGALAPAEVGAHAVVVETEPRRSAALDAAPDRVSIRFNEAIESQFGALRVFDVDGNEVQVGDAIRPASSEIAVRLPDDLPDGAYTATFRVVSADSHPVSGGFTFTVGSAGGASAAGVADLLGDQSAGPVTDAIFGATRVVSYAAIALLAGGTLFLLTTWLPSIHTTRPQDGRETQQQAPRATTLASAGGVGFDGPASLRDGRETHRQDPRGAPSQPWSEATRAFQRKATKIMLGAALAGVAASAIGLVAQGATAAGTGFLEALDPALIGDVLATRFGEIWTLRVVAFAALALLLLRLPPVAARAGGRLPVGPARALAVAAALAFLVVSPALAGHAAAAAADSRWLVPLDAVHVAAMCAWVGGIALIVYALPAATRRLAGGDRTRLLAAVLGRFSTVALVAVAALLLSGVVQSLLYLDALDQLWETAFGRAILVKAVLFAALIGFGAYHRRRSVPALREIAARGAQPGRAGVALRRALRGELVLFAAVLVATAALATYSPSATADGPFGGSIELGPAQLEITVDPAEAGDNEIHLYLFDRETGAQYDRPRELLLSARQEKLDIGPIEFDVRKAGPGHYAAMRAPMAPTGYWTLEVRAPVSDFEELRGEIELRIR